MRVSFHVRVCACMRVCMHVSVRAFSHVHVNVIIHRLTFIYCTVTTVCQNGQEDKIFQLIFLSKQTNSEDTFSLSTTKETIVTVCLCVSTFLN